MMKYLKSFLWLILNIVLACILGTALLCAAFLLPVDRIEEHVRRSAFIVQEEGVYPTLSAGFSSTLDNFTDSIMLLEAADRTDAPLLKKAMGAYRGNIGDLNNPAAMLVWHYVDETDFDRTYDYPRYWHGYLIFLKPLLEFFDLKMIRILNGAVQALLVLLGCYLLLERKKDMYLIPWLLGYLMLMPIVMAKSLQYSSCFYVFLAGSIALLLLPDGKLQKYGAAVFLNIGIALAFFDFLTYPAATFGVPMAVYLMLTESETIGKRFLSIIRNGICWGIGYGGMWASKWILGSRILGRDIIADGLSAFTERTSGVQLNKGLVVLSNYREFLRTSVIYVAAVCLVWLIYMIVRKRTSLAGKWPGMILPYLLTGLVPAAWYGFAANHSAVHTWFTSKACIVTFLAVMFGLAGLSQMKNTEGKKADGSDSGTDSVL